MDAHKLGLLNAIEDMLPGCLVGEQGHTCGEYYLYAIPAARNPLATTRERALYPVARTWAMLTPIGSPILAAYAFELRRQLKEQGYEPGATERG